MLKEVAVYFIIIIMNKKKFGSVNYKLFVLMYCLM